MEATPKNFVVMCSGNVTREKLLTKLLSNFKSQNHGFDALSKNTVKAVKLLLRQLQIHKTSEPFTPMQFARLYKKKNLIEKKRSYSDLFLPKCFNYKYLI
jgi:hypothetical protein